MKVSQMIGFQQSVRLIIEAENPAELAIVKLLNGCEAKCEEKAPEINPQQNATVPTPDPVLHINIAVKKDSRY